MPVPMSGSCLARSSPASRPGASLVSAPSIWSDASATTTRSSFTLMWCDSLDSVKAFRGQDYEVAHVPQEAQSVLSHFDKRSAHYEVLERRQQPDRQSASTRPS